jgi:hypothetical protein
MAEKEKEKKPDIGVINPYALVEVILKRRVNWGRIADPQKLLEETLEMPYEKLFDPKYGSPLYAGTKFEPETMSLKRVEIPPTAKGAQRALVEVGDTTVWVDPGDFFEEAAELSDPIQGAVGNCYFISALSSVAWARPYVIAQRTRATGVEQQQFVDMIEFYKEGKAEKVEVTELLPLISPGNIFIFARSSEPGEIWPAVYEKAFAKWKTKDPGDNPDILKTARGDPVGALALLTGMTPYYYVNSDLSEDKIWQIVSQNCFRRKTFNPMVTWTWDSSPPGCNYSNAHIVASHAYSILGCQYANTQRYIVLRNPWGTKEAVLNVEGGTWIAWDSPYPPTRIQMGRTELQIAGPGWWRPIDMATADGIFALRVDSFKKCFAGFGLVK